MVEHELQLQEQSEMAARKASKSQDDLAKLSHFGTMRMLHSLPTACEYGRFGADCEYRCIDCKNGGKCRRNKSGCECASGYTGTICEDQCPEGTWGLNCKNACECDGQICNRITGECDCPNGAKCDDSCPAARKQLCTFDISSGRTSEGIHSILSLSCLYFSLTNGNTGFYGPSCNLPCQMTCSNGRCDRKYGYCSCPAGYYGEKCDQICPRFNYGRNCRHVCNCEKEYSEGCEPKSGKCICKSGFYGPFCKRRCPVGFYGQSCTKKCECAKNQECDSATGDCIRKCRPGYTGDDCQNPCPAGTYGYNCVQKCACETGASQVCHHVTGTCTCRPVCPSGLYGPNCQHECVCRNNGTCNSKDGSCICPAGYYGAACSEGISFFIITAICV
ncbi:unnamed protein product [Onchocerca flexuosa]|uniref:EGF-like domain protein n=1 Tax=Onchocerca flexuosa TaxID=387005 RepID=A0A183HB08_9BILA|nr:unnamed protein product [Onchocerca flexuosa]